MTITDEMLDKAEKAFIYLGPDWGRRLQMRAALEAVAPMLIAKGVENIVGELYINPPQILCADTLDAVLARAQELDPK